jgi:hypothetical protein
MFEMQSRAVIRPSIAALYFVLLSSFYASAASVTSQKVDFNRDIRPILSENCYKCHGPDDGARKAKLRFDLKEFPFKPAKSGAIPVVPGSLEKSALVARITTTDADDLMPPVKSGKKLTPAQIDLLKRWISQGAPYATHWAYVKPVRPNLPVVRNKRWPKNPIDSFILARLEKEHLHPSTAANPFILARRVALDLTGLPPTPEEAETFATNPTGKAYERLVDRLLTKPSFGEHWARMWLDLARYADSAGYADDPPRTIWAYRDYVIRSFNENKPFDRFTIEQIAGDLLDDPDDDDEIATAFHRNTMTNNEGGTSDEEFRNAAVVDRVNTTMSVWMATTMGCAQCHTHKYDPLSQTEYFRLFAIFNNSADADLKEETPVFKIYSPEQHAERSRAMAEIKAIEKSFEAAGARSAAKQETWEEGFPKNMAWQALAIRQASASSGGTARKTSETVFSARPSLKTDTYTVRLAPAVESIAGLRIEALPFKTTAEQGGYSITHVAASVIPGGGNPTEPEEKSTRQEKSSKTAPNSIAFDAIFSDSGNAADLTALARMKEKGKVSWGLGPSTVSRFLTLLPREGLHLKRDDLLEVSIQQKTEHDHFPDVSFTVAATDDPAAAAYANVPSNIVSIIRTDSDRRTAAQKKALTEFFEATIDPEGKAQREKLAALRKRLNEMPAETVPVMQELVADHRRKTRIQIRGNYLALSDEVTAGVPAVFHPLTRTLPPNRLGLAKWLVDENNPLTARVLVNRLWDQIFGVGIVRTSEDFGSQGDLPTHPELLDWLATEMLATHWDIKGFLKMVVSSATYQQSSKVNRELLEKDPDNLLLARGPRFRSPAEVVRDQALAVSGLLSSKMYGPPVRPPAPSLGLTAAFGGSLDWKPSEGEDLHRRAVYTEWRRTAPYPSMATFDAPNREVCALRRPRSNTPLQALVTLNDPVYIEAAQALAAKIAQSSGNPQEKAAFGFRSCLTRPAKQKEINRLVELHDRAVSQYRTNVEDARKMAGPAVEKTAPIDTLSDRAAWTVVANVLLNLDEFLMKP